MFCFHRLLIIKLGENKLIILKKVRNQRKKIREMLRVAVKKGKPETRRNVKENLGNEQRNRMRIQFCQKTTSKLKQNTHQITNMRVGDEVA